MDDDDKFIRELVCELCRQFFVAGWVTGTGGSISIRSKLNGNIYMTPSGVQKERIQPADLFIVDMEGKVIKPPLNEILPGCPPPKLSDCAPLFLHAFRQRNAGAVLHSHAICCNLVTSLFEGESEFRISQQEMIKGIAGYGYFDELVIPIIENTAWEHELADSLGAAIAAYPRACAVLVRRHGMYVWGSGWEQAKRHGECLHYLFELALQRRTLGLDPPPSVKSRKRAAPSPAFRHLLLDIEGTLSPLAFVREQLFPYAAKHARSFLAATWTSPDTQAVVRDLLAQAHKDASSEPHDPSALQLPSEPAGPEEALLDALEQYVQRCIALDRKLGPLKTLQGLLWRRGYEAGELRGQVFEDVPASLKALRALGLPCSLYSSGSKQAQRLLFAHSTCGDLTPYFHSYFDTQMGPKTLPSSYRDIALSLGGVEGPGEVLFVTDLEAEAQAARAAGMQTRISLRPGNAPLEQTAGPEAFACISSLWELPGLEL